VPFSSLAIGCVVRGLAEQLSNAGLEDLLTGLRRAHSRGVGCDKMSTIFPSAWTLLGSTCPLIIARCSR
jgi:hypothetical protein